MLNGVFNMAERFVGSRHILVSAQIKTEGENVAEKKTAE